MAEEYKPGFVIKPEHFNDLKAAIKAECLARNGKGSVANYGGSSYDYTVTPSSGATITVEHFNKIAEPLRAIVGSSAPNNRNSGDVIDAKTLNDMNDKVKWLAEIRDKTGGVTDDRETAGCAASCTGLCYDSCTGSCKGECINTCLSGCNTALRSRTDTTSRMRLVYDPDSGETKVVWSNYLTGEILDT